MKNTKFLAIVVAMFIFVSCKKNDLQDVSFNNDPVNNTESSVDNSATAKPSFSEWASVSNWNNEKKDGYNVYTGSFTDPTITSDITSSGLVLVFAKTGNTTESLPYNRENISWYYQVANGSIAVTATASANATIDKSQTFSYVVLSKDQLNNLEAKGVTKSQLMNLSYQNVVSVLQ